MIQRTWKLAFRPRNLKSMQMDSTNCQGFAISDHLEPHTGVCAWGTTTSAVPGNGHSFTEGSHQLYRRTLKLGRPFINVCLSLLNLNRKSCTTGLFSTNKTRCQYRSTQRSTQRDGKGYRATLHKSCASEVCITVLCACFGSLRATPVVSDR
jgi:hypothetical protein